MAVKKNCSEVHIAFFDAKPYDIEFFDAANQDFGFKLTYLKVHLSPETVSLASGFDAVCVFVNDTVSAEVGRVLERYGIHLIAVRAAGYNNLDFKSLYEKIHVVRVPAYSPHGVAEHAVALMLSLNRKIHKAYYRTRDANFNIHGLLGFDMCGKKAGIVGTGKIGRVAAKILKGFEMEVLTYDLFQDPVFEKENGCRYVDLDTLFRQSDIISLHCPLTKDTFHLVNEGTIAKMKPGVMVINTGRGHLIDTHALIEGLKSGRIGSAGLDVYEEESEYFFEDFSNSVITDDILGRLLSFPNVLVTSHQAFFTREALQNIARTTLENIRGFFLHGTLANEVCYRCSQNQCVRKEQGRCF